LQFELVGGWLRAERQKDLHGAYRDVRIDCGDRMDLLVEHRIIVALKAVAKLEPNHQVQLLSCPRLSGCPVDLLINFNGKLLRNGVRWLVNGLEE
jgi:GxxExxY protein